MCPLKSREHQVVPVKMQLDPTVDDLRLISELLVVLFVNLLLTTRTLTKQTFEWRILLVASGTLSVW